MWCSVRKTVLDKYDNIRTHVRAGSRTRTHQMCYEYRQSFKFIVSWQQISDKIHIIYIKISHLCRHFASLDAKKVVIQFLL